MLKAKYEEKKRKKQDAMDVMQKLSKKKILIKKLKAAKICGK